MTNTNLLNLNAKVTEAERKQLKLEAIKEGKTLNELVRERLGLGAIYQRQRRARLAKEKP